MPQPSEDRRIPVSRIGGALFASLQVDPQPELMQQLREDLLAAAHHHRARGAVLDISGIAGMDGVVYQQLEYTVRMLALLGVTCVLAGMRPGIVAALSVLDVDLTQIRGAVDIEQALQLLDRPHAPAP